MSQTEKAGFYKALKAAGVTFDKHYREYSTAELKTAYDRLVEAQPEFAVPEEEPAPAPPPPVVEEELTEAEAAAFFGGSPAPEPERPARMPEPAPRQAVPVAARDENEMPGQRLNTSVELEPIRTDEQGRVWYQEEVLKPAFPKPRGRRVLKYMESGVTVQTVQSGDYVETFEVADGAAPRRESEVKITLPSYQVGIYKDRRFPFKIHTYNGNQGFDLFEVQNYYGGSELVPTEIKRMYVENVLCYDIRTTVRSIQTEFRQLQLAGKVK